jgi:hypothetical protein
MPDDFPGRWEDTVVMPQAEIQAYVGEHGDIVIKQIDWPNEDTVITVRPEHIPALVERLLALVNDAVELGRGLG